MAPTRYRASRAIWRKKADFTCADLKAHNYNCVWANNLGIGGHGDAWLTAGEKHGVRIILQGGGAPDLLRLEPPYTGPDAFENREYLDKTVIPHWTALAVEVPRQPGVAGLLPGRGVPSVSACQVQVLRRVTRLVEAIDPAHPAL